jgi:predicted AAA+ superfamily ATPase
MNAKYPRWQEQNVKTALENRRVVVISGARQTGKTTLAELVAGGQENIRSLDNSGMLRLATEDPKSFLKNPSGTMVIDEIQKAPGLIPEIKLIVDHDDRKGQYLLTGSANILTLPGVSESLAGRVSHIRLRPLSAGEILKRKPSFLERAFKLDFPALIKGYDKEAIIDLAFRGGYPEVMAMTDKRERRAWHNEYINTIIERDMKDIANIRRRDTLRELIAILASWSAKFMDINQICSSLGASKETIESYINMLEMLFLFDKAPPWIRTDYDRVGRRQKFYAADTGLMTSVLNWKQEDIPLDIDRSGKLVETLVYQELAAHIDASRYEYSLFQYRDRRDREIDFIVERDDGSLLGIEVKSSQSFSTDDFNHLKWFRDNLAKKPFKGIVLYAGSDSLPYGEDMYAVPIAALWDA